MVNLPQDPPAEAAEPAPPSPAVDTAARLAAEPPAGNATVPPRHTPNIWILGAVALTALTVASLALVWSTQQRVKALEQELVRRQQSSQDQATEAKALARQAHDSAAEAEAKTGLLEARVAETALQRSQVEDLIQSLSRSRDENVLADVEAALRVAQQQSAITGSAEPLVAALRQSDERLARYNQPRLDRVRRAVTRDLDRTRAAQTVDVSTLAIRLDEAIRLADELPLANSAARGTPSPARPLAAPSASAGMGGESAWQDVLGRVWAEVRSLVRVSRVDHPEAALMAPDQGFFLRENLKLRLLNARLSLLSRQFDLAQADLAQAQALLERFFDRGSRRVATAGEQIRQVAQQAHQVTLPRPDETLAALAAAASGR